ncbi:hypothetical protein PENTCL1PPCAC_3723, partial [Pristionchus entomophagus]
APMYILYLQPLITDIIFLLIIMCYLAPAVLIQNNICPLHMRLYASYILDSAQAFCFFNNSLSHVSLAANRLVVTVHPRFDIFTKSRSVIISIVQQLIDLLICITAQFSLPCCRLEIDYTIFNFRQVLVPGMPNYVLAYIQLPVKIVFSAIPFIIYCFVGDIHHHLKVRSSYTYRVSNPLEHARFAAQFATISFIYILSWLMFSVI